MCRNRQLRKRQWGKTLIHAGRRREISLAHELRILIISNCPLCGGPLNNRLQLSLGSRPPHSMIITYLLIQSALLAICVGSFFQVRQFVRMYPTITTAEEMTHYRRLARMNMYTALIYIGLSAPMVVLSAYLAYLYGLYGVAISVAATAPHFVFARFMKKQEDTCRSAACAPQFEEEHRRIGRSWLKNVLPDF